MSEEKRFIRIPVAVRTGVHDGGDPNYAGHCGKCRFIVRVPFSGGKGCSLFDTKLEPDENSSLGRTLDCQLAESCAGDLP